MNFSFLCLFLPLALFAQTLTPEKGGESVRAQLPQ
jgi:hypothetical protein